jgi:hypothetical protein
VVMWKLGFSVSKKCSVSSEKNMSKKKGMYLKESILAVRVVFPRHKNNIAENICCTAVMCKNLIFSSALGPCDDPSRVSC